MSILYLLIITLTVNLTSAFSDSLMASGLNPPEISRTTNSLVAEGGSAWHILGGYAIMFFLGRNLFKFTKIRGNQAE